MTREASRRFRERHRAPGWVAPVPHEALIGQRFGRLVVQSIVRERHVASAARCLCDCGTTTVVRVSNVKNGSSRSCGCLGDESRRSAKKHGESRHGRRTIESRTWCGMKDRCANLDDMDYGGRGIRVCERWANSFEAFLSDVGRRPTPGHSIDRIDVNGNYEPGNVRWATRSQQARNTRLVPRYLIDGEMLCPADVHDRFGIRVSLFCARIDRGMDPVAAAKAPVGSIQRGKPARERPARVVPIVPRYQLGAESLTIRELEARSSIPYSDIRRRIVWLGWSVERATTEPVARRSTWRGVPRVGALNVQTKATGT